jgi:hypothetical protein
MVEWALYYGEIGMAVFPCSGKTPAIPKAAGGRGFYDATTDLQQIQAFWQQYPAANIGYRTDAFHPTFDIDPRHDGDVTLFTLEQAHRPLPDTMRAISGGPDKGQHYYFTSTQPIPNKVHLGSGIDVQAEGAYIMLPPSIHPVTGQPYLWDVGPDELAPQPLPDWLLQLCMQGGSGQQTGSVQGPGAADEVIPQGRRTRTLAHRAIQLRRIGGCSAEVLLAALETMNRLYCQPPLEPERVGKIAHDVFGKYPPDPAMHVSSDRLDTMLRTLHGPMNGTTNSTAPYPQQWGTPQPHAVFTDFADMLERTYPLPVWNVKGLIQEGFNILAGSPKSSKTYLIHSLALTMALESVLGGLWLDHYPIEHHGPVVYVSLEDDEGDSFLRCCELVPGLKQIDRHRLIFCNDWEHVPTLGHGLTEFIEEQILKPFAPALVVLDPLSYLYPQAKHGGDQFQTLRHWLLPLRYLGKRYHTALVGVEHRRKQSKDDISIVETIHGSNAKIAIADSLLVIVRDQTDVTMHATVRKGSDQTISLEFTFDQDGAAHWTWKGSTEGLLQMGTHSDMRIRVSQYLGASPLSSFTIPDIVSHLHLAQTPQTQNMIQQLLYRMEKDGEVMKVSRGHYSWVGSKTP